MLTEKESVDAVHAAQRAFDNGRGSWPRMTVRTCYLIDVNLIILARLKSASTMLSNSLPA